MECRNILFASSYIPLFLIDGRRIDSQGIGPNLAIVYFVLGSNRCFVVPYVLGRIFVTAGEQRTSE